MDGVMQHIGTFLVLAALAAAVVMMIAYLRRKKKGGACGCGCSNCPMAGKCHRDP